MFEVSGRMASAGADGVSSPGPEAPPPCGSVAPARLVNQRLTPAIGTRVCDAKLSGPRYAFRRTPRARPSRAEPSRALQCARRHRGCLTFLEGLSCNSISEASATSECVRRTPASPPESSPAADRLQAGHLPWRSWTLRHLHGSHGPRRGIERSDWLFRAGTAPDPCKVGDHQPLSKDRRQEKFNNLNED